MKLLTLIIIGLAPLASFAGGDEGGGITNYPGRHASAMTFNASEANNDLPLGLVQIEVESPFIFSNPGVLIFNSAGSMVRFEQFVTTTEFQSIPYGYGQDWVAVRYEKLNANNILDFESCDVFWGKNKVMGGNRIGERINSDVLYQTPQLSYGLEASKAINNWVIIHLK